MFGRRGVSGIRFSVLDASAGEIEEHVVERRGAQGEVANGDLGVAQRDGDGSDRLGPARHADHQLVVAGVDGIHLVELTERSHCRVGITVDPGDDDVLTDSSLQLDRRAFGHEAAGVDDADPVGQHVGFLEVLRGEEDRHAQLGVEPAYLFPHLDPADRIEARGRLVEEEHLGVVHQRRGQVESALHATRVGRDASVERVAEIDHPGELAQSLIGLGVGQAVEPRLHAQQLGAGLLGIESDVLQRDSDAGAHPTRLGGDVVPAHRGSSRGGAEQGAQHAHGGGLAGAVGSEEPVDLAAVYL